MYSILLSVISKIVMQILQRNLDTKNMEKFTIKTFRKKMKKCGKKAKQDAPHMKNILKL